MYHKLRERRGRAAMCWRSLAWGRGIGSATGLCFLEPLIVANIPAFLWLGYYGFLVSRSAREDHA